jgi:hypothetical protein
MNFGIFIMALVILLLKVFAVRINEFYGRYSMDIIEDEYLDEAKTSLDKIIAGYEEPLSHGVKEDAEHPISAEYKNWLKNVVGSDSKSRLKACADKLILHKLEWEGILNS